jgi:hypothetical protein
MPTDREVLLVDEICTIQGKTRFLLTSDLSMLKAALDALRKNKSHVAIDHLERVIQNFEKFLTGDTLSGVKENLKGELS